MPETRAKIAGRDESGPGPEPRLPPLQHAMPPLRIRFRAAGRSATRWIATVFFGLTPGLAAADHGAPALPPRTGLDWTSWLLIAGAVAAVSLAAWAFFAPDRTEARPDPSAPGGSEPEPPVRTAR